MIVVDDREVAEHPDIPEILEKYKLPFAIGRLEEADYAFLGWNRITVGIERSEISNLIYKMQSGELESQLERCSRSYGSVILLVEGISHHLGGNLALYRGSHDKRVFYRNYVFPHMGLVELIALEVRLSQLGIEILHATDFEYSMLMVKTIYDQRTKPEEAHRLFRRIREPTIPTKLSANPAVPKLLALCDRMPEKVAIRLIYKYDTIWNVLHQSNEELLSIEGLGKGLLRKLREGIGKPDGIQ